MIDDVICEVFGVLVFWCLWVEMLFGLIEVLVGEKEFMDDVDCFKVVD